MKALVYRQFQQPPRVETVPDPSPLEHGIVVKVKASGLCRSDWHGWMGYDKDITLPHVPGHEFAGEVVACGSGIKNLKNGDRVTVPFVAGCGHCIYCNQGDPQVCDNQFQPGFTHWGSFSEYVALDYADFNVVHLPDAISYDNAAALGCRFATSYRALMHQARLQADQYVAVFGCGGVGLSAILIAKAVGARVMAIDLKDSALALAEQYGADLAIRATEQHLSQQILDYSRGGVHVTLDALGHPQIIKDCFSVLRKRGRHIQIGLLDPEDCNVEIPMDRVIAHELEVLGSHGMQSAYYPQLMQLIMSQNIDLAELIQKRLKLSEAAVALSNMDQTAVAGVQLITEFAS
jgi:alcohol dehydrogenase